MLRQTVNQEVQSQIHKTALLRQNGWEHHFLVFQILLCLWDCAWWPASAHLGSTMMKIPVFLLVSLPLCHPFPSTCSVLHESYMQFYCGIGRECANMWHVQGCECHIWLPRDHQWETGFLVSSNIWYAMLWLPICMYSVVSLVLRGSLWCRLHWIQGACSQAATLASVDHRASSGCCSLAGFVGLY